MNAESLRLQKIAKEKPGLFGFGIYREIKLLKDKESSKKKLKELKKEKIKRVKEEETRKLFNIYNAKRLQMEKVEEEKERRARMEKAHLALGFDW